MTSGARTRTLTGRVALIALGAVAGIFGTLTLKSSNIGDALLGQQDVKNKTVEGRLDRITPSVSPIVGSATSPAIDPAFQDRLIKEIVTTVQITVAHELEQGAAVSGKSASLNTAALPQQQKSYEDLRTELQNPVYNRTLTWNQLAANPRVQSLPKELRDKLLGEVADMLTRGELNPDYFLNVPMKH